MNGYNVSYRQTSDQEMPVQVPDELWTNATLAEVIQACLDYGVCADLHDEPGFCVGHVKSDGSYRLG